jgi:hypothetical protein
VPDATGAKADGVDSSASATVAAWLTSYQPQETDSAGTALRATEVMGIKEHGGRLWAATGNWSFDTTSGPQPPPQVLILDESSGRWQASKIFDDKDGNGGYRFSRVSALTELAPAPGSPAMLAATLDSAGDQSGQGTVFVLNDDSGNWIDTQLSGLSVRALVRFDDPVSGRHLVFAGGGAKGTGAAIYRGRIDPSQPSKGTIVWEAQEISALQARVMAFASAGGNLYATDKTHLYVRYHRIDGTPAWQQIYTYTAYPPAVGNDSRVSGLRALTAFDTSAGTYLLAAAEWSGEVLKIALDPKDIGHVSVATEFNVRTALTQSWGALATPNVIAAYTDMPKLLDPTTQEPLNLLGLLTEQPGNETSAWFLTRNLAGQYRLYEVPADPSTRSRSSDPRLRSIRALQTHGDMLYLGGCDGAYVPDVDTGWIYRRTIKDALTGGFSL